MGPDTGFVVGAVIIGAGGATTGEVTTGGVATVAGVLVSLVKTLPVALAAAMMSDKL